MQRLRFTPFVLSVLIHVVLFGAFFITWKATSEPKVVKPPRYIEAKLVKLKSETKKAPPKQQPRKVDLTKKQPPAAPPKKAQPAKKAPDLEKEKREKEKVEQERKRRAEEERKKQLERQQMLEELEKALKEEERAAAEAQMEEEALSYMELVQQKVQNNWNRPPSARSGMQCELLIQLVPTGRVVGVSVVKSSGNAAFDRSAEQAVRKAEVFPELKEMSPDVFEKYYRQMKLLFNPQDMRQ